MKLTLVMLDTHRTYMAVTYENEHVPHGRRTVQLELTPEQMKQIEPRSVGTMDGKDVREVYGPCWLEG